jgi:hypothetical protein
MFVEVGGALVAVVETLNRRSHLQIRQYGLHCVIRSPTLHYQEANSPQLRGLELWVVFQPNKRHRTKSWQRAGAWTDRRGHVFTHVGRASTNNNETSLDSR